MSEICHGNPCARAKIVFETIAVMDREIDSVGAIAMRGVDLLHDEAGDRIPMAEQVLEINTEALDALTRSRDIFAQQLKVCEVCPGKTQCALAETNTSS